MWKTDPNTSIITYTQNMSPIVELLRGDWGRKERRRENNTEIYLICIGTRHNETH
jgi:hypothetical protein